MIKPKLLRYENVHLALYYFHNGISWIKACYTQFLMQFVITASIYSLSYKFVANLNVLTSSKKSLFQHSAHPFIWRKIDIHLSFILSLFWWFSRAWLQNLRLLLDLKTLFFFLVCISVLCSVIDDPRPGSRNSAARQRALQIILGLADNSNIT